MPKNWRAPVVRLVRYGGIDAVLFPLNIGIAWALTVAGVEYRIATACGFFIHLTLAFFANRKWTFHSSVDTTVGLGKTWLIGLSDLVVAVIATSLLVEYAGLTFLLARTGAALVVFVWDYVLNCTLTFKEKLFS